MLSVTLREQHIYCFHRLFFFLMEPLRVRTQREITFAAEDVVAAGTAYVMPSPTTDRSQGSKKLLFGFLFVFTCTVLYFSGSNGNEKVTVVRLQRGAPKNSVRDHGRYLRPAFQPVIFMTMPNLSGDIPNDDKAKVVLKTAAMVASQQNISFVVWPSGVPLWLSDSAITTLVSPSLRPSKTIAWVGPNVQDSTSVEAASFSELVFVDPRATMNMIFFSSECPFEWLQRQVSHYVSATWRVLVLGEGASLLPMVLDSRPHLIVSASPIPSSDLQNALVSSPQQCIISNGISPGEVALGVHMITRTTMSTRMVSPSGRSVGEACVVDLGVTG